MENTFENTGVDLDVEEMLRANSKKFLPVWARVFKALNNMQCGALVMSVLRTGLSCARTARRGGGLGQHQNPRVRSRSRRVVHTHRAAYPPSDITGP